MFPVDKIIDFFLMCDDFSRVFGKIIELKYIFHVQK